MMAEGQLQTAHDLIEQGRIAEARRLLETIDDPIARQWLAQLNASKRTQKLTYTIPLPLPWLIGIAVVIGLIALVVMILLTPRLIASLQHNGANAANNAPTLSSDDTALIAELRQFCTTDSADCTNWATKVVTDYHDQAAACLKQSSDVKAFSVCLADAGVPPP